jgi:hypothetical protein
MRQAAEEATMPNVTCHWIAESKINHIIFHKATRRAIEEYFDWQKDHLEESVAEGGGLTLIDIRQCGMPPLMHFRRLNTWLKANYRIPERSYTAILHKANALMALFDSATAMLRRDAARDKLYLFTDEAALAWLLDCRRVGLSA